MADLSITAASVIASSANVINVTAGAVVSAGQAVYQDPADKKYKLADNDSATVAARSPKGIALNSAANGQPLAVATGGPVTIGATLTPGVAYYLSSTPGGICPVADLGTGDYPVIIGIATSPSVLKVAIVESGVAL